METIDYIKLDKIDEILERLAYVDCCIDEYDSTNKTVKFCCYECKEKKEDTLYGFHYYGVLKGYIVYLEDFEMTIEELVFQVALRIKDILLKNMKNKVKEFDDFLTNEINYIG